MKAIHVKRLRKLEQHLRTGKLGHAKFDFATMNAMTARKPKGWTPPIKGCGTNGCAIGECPFVFPKSWMFDDSGWPTPREAGNDSDPADEMQQKFFGLDTYEFLHLFYPESQSPNDYGGKRLGARATRIEVADNIRDFLKIKLRQRRTVKK